MHREQHGCSSELLRYSASDVGIEIKPIPVFQLNVIVRASYREPSLCLYLIKATKEVRDEAPDKTGESSTGTCIYFSAVIKSVNLQIYTS